MAQKYFVDTNILIYAHDRSAGTKHDRARQLIERLWASGEGVLSTQVLYELTGTPPRLIESFEAAAKSGRKPGLAEGLGAGMALDRVATSAAVSAGAAAASEVSGATVEDDGTRMGKEIAKKLAPFFIAQGWIPPQ